MRNSALSRALLTVLACATIFSACQKQADLEGQPANNEKYDKYFRTSGVVEDDPEQVAKVPLIVSSEEVLMAAPSKGGGKAKDTDGDGIPDSSDGCPTQKETKNGYQDSDGCPDTAPPPTSTDTDGDGIADTADACPTSKETFNGYQDSDGCPDTIPDTDGDGIDDFTDNCKTEPENYNGFEDNDGCPDVPPIVVSPGTLPSNFFLATPPIGKQGNEASCVPFATTYAARSIEYYYKTNATTFNTAANIFSPEFVYNQIKVTDCGSGSSLITAMDLLVSKGACTWDAMPYSDINGCSVMPTSTQIANAGNYKIASYGKIVNSDKMTIKTMLTQKHPVIITMTIDDSFMNAGPGFIWKSYSGSGAVQHSMIICGYDDVKNAYKIMNSFGTSWGDAGFSWIDYDFFPQKASYYVYALQ